MLFKGDHTILPLSSTTWKGNRSLRFSLPCLPVSTLFRQIINLHLLWTSIIMSAYTSSMSDVHTLSTWIKPICICSLSSWSEIYSRIIFFLKVQNHICSWDCLWVKKCGIFIANSICIQYADLQILDSLPKFIVKQTGWLAAFSWWTRRNSLKRGRVLAKISDHGFMVCTMQCHPASPRGVGTSLKHSTFLTGIWIWILGKCQHHSDEPW